jgi:hypothetical protein
VSYERERIAVGDQGEQATRVCSTRHSGVFLENTGSVDVVVDTRAYIELDGRDAGITVRVGQMVTIPASLDGPRALYAVAAGGIGELTYVFF